MEFSSVIAIVALLLIGTYLFLQFFTTLLDRSYTASILLLLLVSFVGWLTGASIIRDFGVSWAILPVLSGWVAVSSLFLGLFVVKAFFVTEGRFTSSHALLRTNTAFTEPHEKFGVWTQDGIQIAGVRIAGGHPNAVIVCEGGGRSKNILGNVMLCEWLSARYDVLTFDFRGHYESGGILGGEGDTMFDLKAVIEYAHTLGYRRIGVVGRSLGGWSAILSAAVFQNIDSVVAAAAPMGRLGETAVLQNVPRWLHPIIVRSIARIVGGIRIGSFDGGANLGDVISKVSPIPLLLIYCQSDPTTGMAGDDVEYLFELAGEPKELLVFEGHGHVLETRYLHRYYKSVVEWFERTL